DYLQQQDDVCVCVWVSPMQEERHGRPGSGPTLTSWVQEQQRRHPTKILSLVVIDLEKYFRSQKSQSQKRFREAVTGEERGGGGQVKKRRKNGGANVLPEVSRVELEEAVVHLQLHNGVTVCFLSTWKDFCDHITMTTKAVAEAPFKREREKTGFSFHLESEWAGGQRVDKAGKGLLQVWKRQIQQFNRVSPDMASAILAAYPSPQLLRKAYGLCKSERERISLLSDLLIRRGEGVTSTTRRVGPELSKRLFLLMNSCDPEQTLDSTV
ncbi:crossover junction endonuclease EME1-like, partial [Plectropomus leopardus]|uniref:crossover junction endonuclease EME1-like n=1 Tax=Plectropomus leopardus TaxID=160734 RepID=UPI001C4D41C1